MFIYCNWLWIVVCAQLYQMHSQCTKHVLYLLSHHIFFTSFFVVYFTVPFRLFKGSVIFSGKKINLYLLCKCCFVDEL